VTAGQALRFIERHGIVLEAGQGPVPALATEVLGEGSSGSWWAHPRAREFFRLTREVRDEPRILVCKLLAGKITYVHRRLWPALVRLSRDIGAARLTAVREVHTANGRHAMQLTAFPGWVPSDVRRQARILDREDALATLTASVPAAALVKPRSTRR
jgi:hypothetical protein